MAFQINLPSFLSRVLPIADPIKQVRSAKRSVSPSFVTLRPQRDLNHRNYLSLIEEGERAIKHGAKTIEVNLEKAEQITIAGLFALYTLSLLCQEKEAPSFEEGRNAIAQMGKTLARNDWSSPLIVKNANPQIMQQLKDWNFLA